MRQLVFVAALAVCLVMVCVVASSDPLVVICSKGNELEYAGGLVFEGLTRIDENQEVIPCLAEHWEVSENELAWIFQLRQNALFHCNVTGVSTEVTSIDVLFSLEQFFGGSEETDRTVQVTIIDRYTVGLKLTAPDVTLPYTLSGIRIVSKDISEKVFNDEREVKISDAVGTGPYWVHDWVPDEYIELARFVDYWGEQPQYESIRFLAAREDCVSRAMLQAGDAHLLMDATVAQYSWAGTELGLKRELSLGDYYIALVFNLENPLFSDLKIRRAISHAIDRECIAEVVYSEAAVLCEGPIHPALLPAGSGLPGYDPQTTLALLGEAGKDPSELGFSILVPVKDQTLYTAALIIQDSLSQLGIPVAVESQDYSGYDSLISEGAFDAVLSYVPVGFPTPILETWVGGSPANIARYQNPYVDELIKSLRSEQDASARQQLYQEIDDGIAYDYPCVWLAYQPRCIVSSADLDVRLNHDIAIIGDPPNATEICLLGFRGNSPYCKCNRYTGYFYVDVYLMTGIADMRCCAGTWRRYYAPAFVSCSCWPWWSSVEIHCRSAGGCIIRVYDF